LHADRILFLECINLEEFDWKQSMQESDVAVDEPSNGTVELAGPEPIRLDELVRRFLSANRDARKVTTDVHARYFGTELNDQSLAPDDNPRIGRRVSRTGSAAPYLRGKLPPGRVNAQIK
jgi:hypothetical protein